MGALGLETVLVGDVREGDGMATFIHVGDGALLHQRFLVLIALVLDETVLFGLDSVASFVAGGETTKRGELSSVGATF